HESCKAQPPAQCSSSSASRRPFRGCVIHVSSPWNHFMYRTHADDLACCRRDFGHDSPPPEFTDRFTRAEKLSGEVDTDYRVPLSQRHLLEGRVLLQASVVYQNVDRAKLFEHPLEHPADLLFVRDIRLYCQCLSAHLF